MAKIKPIKYHYSGIKFTIKERHNKWWLDFYFNKKRVRRSTECHANKDGLIEVKKVIIPEIAMALLDHVTPPEAEKEWTVDEFATEYFELQKNQIREHTLERNIAHYNNHIKPYFGSRLIDTLKPIELEKWQNTKLKTYKPQTVQKYRSILFSILDKAVDNDIIMKNPLAKVTSPKLLKNFRNQEENVEPFTEDELSTLIKEANGYMKNFIRFMYATGARPGEIIALQWDDIDFERKIIKIYKTRMRDKEGDTKTLASTREVDLLPQAEEALRDQMLITGEEGYIFVNSSKNPFYSHDIIGVNFQKLLSKCGVQARVLYNLRHTFASQLISKGADIVWVSKMLGHKDVSITLKVYTKFIEEDDEKRFKKIEKMGTILGTVTI